MNELTLAEALKKGMRQLASGVCVITGRGASGERVAMTASSVTSVSDNPPSLLVCINKKARLDSVLVNTAGFTVNVLQAEQQDVSNICAKPAEGESRFQIGHWEVDSLSGLPYLKDALATFFCDKRQVVDYGTHHIYIGDISRVLVPEQDKALLVYARGKYHHIAD